MVQALQLHTTPTGQPLALQITACRRLSYRMGEPSHCPRAFVLSGLQSSRLFLASRQRDPFATLTARMQACQRSHGSSNCQSGHHPQAGYPGCDARCWQFRLLLNLVSGCRSVHFYFHLMTCRDSRAYILRTAGLNLMEVLARRDLGPAYPRLLTR